jgi:hypothetical protein
MKIRSIYPIALALVAAISAWAADDAKKPRFDGIWRWDFTMPDGGQVTASLKLRIRSNGELAGTSRFRSATETPITNIVVEGTKLSFDVIRDYFGDPVVTHYEGSLKDNIIKGKITATSHGEKQTYDWEAKRASGVDGTWKWTVTFREQPFESRVTLKLEGEKLRGKINSGRGDTDIQHGRFRDNRVTFEVERRGFGGGEKTTNFYRGKLDGDKIVGTFTSTYGGLRTNEWNATRAD